MRTWKTLAAICVAFALVACEQNPADPAAGSGGEISETRFDFLNGPSNPGNVARFESFFITWWEFYETPSGTPMVLVWLPEGDALFSCGGGGTSEPASLQEVLTPSGLKNIEMRKKAEVRAYDLVQFYSMELCDILASPSNGTGQVSYVWTDNDTFGETDSNTWGIRANGTLEHNGGTYRVHLRGNFQWITNRPESFRVLKYDARIF